MIINKKITKYRPFKDPKLNYILTSYCSNKPKDNKNINNQQILKNYVNIFDPRQTNPNKWFKITDIFNKYTYPKIYKDIYDFYDGNISTSNSFKFIVSTHDFTKYTNSHDLGDICSVLKKHNIQAAIALIQIGLNNVSEFRKKINNQDKSDNITQNTSTEQLKQKIIDHYCETLLSRDIERKLGSIYKHITDATHNITEVRTVDFNCPDINLITNKLKDLETLINSDNFIDDLGNFEEICKILDQSKKSKSYYGGAILDANENKMLYVNTISPHKTEYIDIDTLSVGYSIQAEYNDMLILNASDNMDKFNDFNHTNVSESNIKYTGIYTSINNSEDTYISDVSYDIYDAINNLNKQLKSNTSNADIGQFKYIKPVYYTFDSDIFENRNIPEGSICYKYKPVQQDGKYLMAQPCMQVVHNILRKTNECTNFALSLEGYSSFDYNDNKVKIADDSLNDPNKLVPISIDYKGLKSTKYVSIKDLCQTFVDQYVFRAEVPRENSNSRNINFVINAAPIWV
jgi:hypothetical protein